jgi:hypothetical protein
MKSVTLGIRGHGERVLLRACAYTQQGLCCSLRIRAPPCPREGLRPPDMTFHNSIRR